MRVDTRSAKLRDRFAAAAAEERSGVARVLTSLGVPHVVLSTSGDWLRAVRRLPAAAAGELRPPARARRARRRAAARLLWLRYDRRRSAGAARFANLALLPNLVDRRAGPAPPRAAVAVPARADARSSSAWRGRTRQITRPAPRGDGGARDRRLPVDGARTDVTPTRLDAAQGAANAVPRRRSRATYSVALVALRQPRVRRRPADARPLARPRGLDDLDAGRGHGDRRRRRRSPRSSAQRQRAVDGTIPPTSVLLISDGARDGGRTSVATAVRKATALHVPGLDGAASGRRTASSRRSSSAATRSRSACRRAPARCSRSRTATGGEFFQARTSTRARRPSTGTSATRIGHTHREPRDHRPLRRRRDRAPARRRRALSAFWFRRVP